MQIVEKAPPLNGSPMISKNCWEVIVKALDGAKIRKGFFRYLEWGAGNSTVNIVKKIIENKNERAELVSVEHATDFFPILCRSVVEEFGNNNISPTIYFEPYNGVVLSKMDIAHNKELLKSPSIEYQILSANKRIEDVDRFVPSYLPSPWRLLKQTVKRVALQFNYLHRIYCNNYKRIAAQRITFHDIDNFILNTNALKVPGCLIVEHGEVRIMLWHLPSYRSTFWPGDILMEGHFIQMTDYVLAPIQGQFDAILIDGRARSCCVSRVYHNDLLSENGYLCVHDAFRVELKEAFLKFNRDMVFINGNNETIDGKNRCMNGFGAPLLYSGKSLETLNLVISNEMFVYHKKE